MINMNEINDFNKENYNYSRYFLPSILILTAIVFANTLGNNFVNYWDDNGYVTSNEIIKHLNWEHLKIIFSTFFKGNYHPLTTLSYAIEYKLFGLNPFPYHLSNYIVHLLNVAIVYLFINRFTHKPLVAGITALFFAIHPMHVESVAWISERKDLLYTFFFILSLNSYYAYLTKGKKYLSLGWAFCWFLLSLMSKPAAVCLPIILVLIDYYIYKQISWKMLISKIPFFVLALLFGILSVLAQTSNGDIGLPSYYNILDRLFFFSYTTIYYLFQVILPFKLSALHWHPIKSGMLLPIGYYLSLPALLLIIWGVFKSGRFKQILIFGLLFYFITIAMVLQVVPIGKAIVSERYAYVPYIGIFFIFGYLISNIMDNTYAVSRNIKVVFVYIVIFFTGFYSYLTYGRNKMWKNTIVLFNDVVEKYTDQTLAEAIISPQPNFYNFSLNILGMEYVNNKMYKESIETLKNLLSLNSNNAQAHRYLGYAYLCLKDWDNGIKYYQIALEIEPDNEGAKNNLKYMMREKVKNIEDLTERNPTSDNYINLSLLYYKNGNFQKCIEACEKALKIDSKSALAYNNICSAYNALEEWDKAAAACNNAIKINPDYQVAKNNLANALNKKAIKDPEEEDATNQPTSQKYINLSVKYYNHNKFKKCIEAANVAIKLKSDCTEAYNNIGLAYSKLKDYDKSIAAFKKALAIDPKNDYAKNNLNAVLSQKNGK